MRPGRRIDVTIETPVGAVVVKCQVRWAKKAGWRRFEVGLQFLGLTPEDALILAAFSRVEVDCGGRVWEGSERRRHGRVHTEQLRCAFGDIVDLSASGMKIESRGEPIVRAGATLDMTIESLSGPLVVRSKVIWMRHVGGGQYAMGIEFVDLEPEKVEALHDIARTSLRSSF